jgi:transposase
VEHLLGAGITAVKLHDDCLGWTLDWLYEHDVTRLFAGLALRARRAFGVKVGRLHADTTSFSVHGQYALTLPEALETPETLKAAAQANELVDNGAPAVIEVTYGYSRDHCADLKQWMLALVTSAEGVPQFLQPLDGNASDKRALLRAVTELRQQLQQSGETPGVYVADSGLYSAENMTQLNRAGVQWVSRVPETLTAAQDIVQERLKTADGWHSSTDGTRHWWSQQQPDLPQGPERWVVVRTSEGEERAPRCTAKRTGIRRRGRSGCGIWATKPLPACPTGAASPKSCAWTRFTSASYTSWDPPTKTAIWPLRKRRSEGSYSPLDFCRSLAYTFI